MFVWRNHTSIRPAQPMADDSTAMLEYKAKELESIISLYDKLDAGWVPPRAAHFVPSTREWMLEGHLAVMRAANEPPCDDPVLKQRIKDLEAQHAECRERYTEKARDRYAAKPKPNPFAVNMSRVRYAKPTG